VNDRTAYPTILAASPAPVLDLSFGRVWLAGATGFLGSHVAQLLSQNDTVLTSKHGGTTAGREVQALDILDTDAVQESARGCQGAILCTGMVSRNKADAALLHRLHVEGTRAALLGLKRAGVRKVVVASTSGTLAVSTDPKAIATEETAAPLEHIAAWPYYRTKYYGEKEALALAEPGFEVVVACPSLLLGPGDVRESSTGDVRKFLEKSIVATPAGGIAFVDVRDAARGLILCLDKGRGGQRYLLNSSNMTLSAFFARLSRVSGVSAPLLKMPKNKLISSSIFKLYDTTIRNMGGVPPIDEESAEMGQYYWYCSAEKAERLLGFVARDPGETLRDTVTDLFERKVVAPPEMRNS
jgi:dihydroflavonol-4-reductase